MAPTVDAKWVRDPSDELAISEGCWFDADAGEYVCDFIERYCRQSQDRWKGQLIELIPWQRDFVMRLFSWKRPDGTRRYTHAYIEIAKKNGKTTMFSALALYLLLADNAGGPQIYCNACDREQARIVYEQAVAMVRQSPDLAKRLEPIDSRHRIFYGRDNGVLIANSSVVDSKDGRNASAVLFDELHRQPDRQLWNVFQYAGAAREQPLLMSITTAGEEEDGVWFDQREYSEGVIAGTIPDTTHLGIVYRALPGDDIDDPATWLKANPSMGYTLKPEKFARDLTKAKQLPVDLNEFLRLRLNIVARSAQKFLPDGAWAKGNVPVLLDALVGQPWYLGVDLSTVNDLTAWVALCGNFDSGFDLLARFYLPEQNIVQLERAHRQSYRRWATDGWITLTPGASVDYGFIRKDVRDFASTHDVKIINVDPYNATNLAQQWADDDGLPVKKIRQGVFSLNSPTKELLRLATEGKLRHGGNPVLAWHARNAVAKKDENDNIRLDKQRSRGKIDGISSTVNGLAGAMLPEFQGDPHSTGFFVLTY